MGNALPLMLPLQACWEHQLKTQTEEGYSTKNHTSYALIHPESILHPNSPLSRKESSFDKYSQFPILALKIRTDIM